MDDNESSDSNEHNIQTITDMPLDVIHQIFSNGLSFRDIQSLKLTNTQLYKIIDLQKIYDLWESAYNREMMPYIDDIDKTYNNRQRNRFMTCYDPETQCPETDRVLSFLGAVFCVVSIPLGLLNYLDQCKSDSSCRFWMSLIGIASAAIGVLLVFFSSYGLPNLLKLLNWIDQKNNGTFSHCWKKITNDSKIEAYKKFLIYENEYKKKPTDVTPLLDANPRRFYNNS